MAKDSKLWTEAYAASRRVVDYKPKKYKVKSKPVIYKPPTTIAGSDQVHQRLKEINKTMKALRSERAEIKKRLKPWIVEYEKKPYQLYALKLQNSCWYIGISRNPQHRFKRHGTRKGANWTFLHKPIDIYETRMTTLLIESEVVKLEDDMTLEYAMKYGSEFVRGGGYCQMKPRWPALIIQNEKFK